MTSNYISMNSYTINHRFSIHFFWPLCALNMMQVCLRFPLSPCLASLVNKTDRFSSLFYFAGLSLEKALMEEKSIKGVLESIHQIQAERMKRYTKRTEPQAFEEGGGGPSHPLPLFGHIVKDFTKRVYFSQFSPLSFEFLCTPLRTHRTLRLCQLLNVFLSLLTK